VQRTHGTSWQQKDASLLTAWRTIVLCDSNTATTQRREHITIGALLTATATAQRNMVENKQTNKQKSIGSPITFHKWNLWTKEWSDRSKKSASPLNHIMSFVSRKGLWDWNKDMVCQSVGLFIQFQWQISPGNRQTLYSVSNTQAKECSNSWDSWGLARYSSTGLATIVGAQSSIFESLAQSIHTELLCRVSDCEGFSQTDVCECTTIKSLCRRTHSCTQKTASPGMTHA
jgi:hypothetical protein